MSQTSPVTETLAEIIGRHLATVISGNNQPHMSGDPRNRLLGLRRRQFDDACQSAAEAVIASLGHAQCSQQWQPIDTAPKDIEVFVWAPDWNKVGKGFIAKWEDNRYASKPRPYWSYCDERIWGTTKVRQCQPTHWMPLPASPDTSTLGNSK